MTSLVDFLRKRLMLGSQCPSLEEEADWYIHQLEEHMDSVKMGQQERLGWWHMGYDTAVNEMLKFLKEPKAVQEAMYRSERLRFEGNVFDIRWCRSRDWGIHSRPTHTCEVAEVGRWNSHLGHG